MENEVISEKLIFIKQKFKSKDEVIKFISANAFTNKLITDENEVIKSFLEREEIASTAVGFEVAIPHCRNKYITNPFITFISLESSILWDDEEVKLIFAICIADGFGDNLHLKVISQLSRELLDEDFRTFLKNEDDKQEILKKLNKINKGVLL